MFTALEVRSGLRRGRPWWSPPLAAALVPVSGDALHKAPPTAPVLLPPVAGLGKPPLLAVRAGAASKPAPTPAPMKKGKKTVTKQARADVRRIRAGAARWGHTYLKMRSVSEVTRIRYHRKHLEVQAWAKAGQFSLTA